MSADPYGRPTLTYVRDRSRVVPGSSPGWRGLIRVGDREWPTIENAEARPVPAGRCFGRVALKGNGAPCIWLTWGDPDGGEEHQIHAANEAGELRGCIAPGMGESETGVAFSRQALGEIFKELALRATDEAAAHWAKTAPSDPGCVVDYNNPPIGLAVVIEVVEAQTKPGKNGKPWTTLGQVFRWVGNA